MRKLWYWQWTFFWPAEIDTVVRLKSGLQKSGLYRLLAITYCQKRLVQLSGQRFWVRTSKLIEKNNNFQYETSSEFYKECFFNFYFAFLQFLYLFIFRRFVDFYIDFEIIWMILCKLLMSSSWFFDNYLNIIFAVDVVAFVLVKSPARSFQASFRIEL